MAVLEWRGRGADAEPTPPAGLVAAGVAARRLLLRLRQLPDAELARLSVVATRDLLVLLGAADALPWVDGARYCAPDPGARNLWLPTHVAPRLPADLLLAGSGGRAPGQPLLLWNEPEQILPLGHPAALNAAVLDWLERELD